MHKLFYILLIVWSQYSVCDMPKKVNYVVELGAYTQTPVIKIGNVRYESIKRHSDNKFVVKLPILPDNNRCVLVDADYEISCTIDKKSKKVYIILQYMLDRSIWKSKRYMHSNFPKAETLSKKIYHKKYKKIVFLYTKEVTTQIKKLLDGNKLEQTKKKWETPKEKAYQVTILRKKSSKQGHTKSLKNNKNSNTIKYSVKGFILAKKSFPIRINGKEFTVETNKLSVPDSLNKDPRCVLPSEDNSIVCTIDSNTIYIKRKFSLKMMDEHDREELARIREFTLEDDTVHFIYTLDNMNLWRKFLKDKDYMYDKKGITGKKEIVKFVSYTIENYKKIKDTVEFFEIRLKKNDTSVIIQDGSISLPDYEDKECEVVDREGYSCVIDDKKHTITFYKNYTFTGALSWIKQYVHNNRYKTNIKLLSGNSSLRLPLEDTQNEDDFIIIDKKIGVSVDNDNGEITLSVIANKYKIDPKDAKALNKTKIKINDMDSNSIFINVNDTHCKTNKNHYACKLNSTNKTVEILDKYSCTVLEDTPKDLCESYLDEMNVEYFLTGSDYAIRHYQINDLRKFDKTNPFVVNNVKYLISISKKNHAIIIKKKECEKRLINITNTQRLIDDGILSARFFSNQEVCKHYIVYERENENGEFVDSSDKTKVKLFTMEKPEDINKKWICEDYRYVKGVEENSICIEGNVSQEGMIRYTMPVQSNDTLIIVTNSTIFKGMERLIRKIKTIKEGKKKDVMMMESDGSLSDDFPNYDEERTFFDPFKLFNGLEDDMTNIKKDNPSLKKLIFVTARKKLNTSRAQVAQIVIWSAQNKVELEIWSTEDNCKVWRALGPKCTDIKEIKE